MMIPPPLLESSLVAEMINWLHKHGPMERFPDWFRATNQISGIDVKQIGQPIPAPSSLNSLWDARRTKPVDLHFLNLL